MESANLKQQFEVLQEQQQKILARRKQKKDEKQKEKGNAINADGAFGVEDSLTLKLADPPATNSYLSQELVDHLNDQIREFKDENGRLYKLLSERDFEIRNMKRKREEEKAVGGGMQVTNETAATKIVELSKKVRELTAELESEKTKFKQSQKKNHDLQLQIQSSGLQSDGRSMLGSAVSLQSQLTDDKCEDGVVDVKSLQDKMKHTESKLADYRNQCQSLKQEIKIYNKVLQKELGEGVNIQSLLNTQSTWRGRAQQILGLQNKIEEMKTQLESTQSKEMSLEDQFMGKTSARRRTQDDKYKEELRKLDKEKKENKERAAAELKALEEEHTSLKQKMEATKARNNVLSTEMKSLKQRVTTLLQKGQNDDELIQALMKQQSQLKQLLDDNNKRQQESLSLQQDVLKDFSIKHQQDNNVVEQLKLIAAEREARMRELEQEIEQLKINVQYQGRMEMNNVAPVSMDTQLQLGSRPGTATVETGFRLSSVTPTASRQSERPLTVMDVMNGSRSTSRVSVRPGSVRNGPGGDLVYQCQEYQMLMQAAEVEREKLAEFVQVLQKRNDEMTMKLTDSQTELIQQRRRNVTLEKQLGKSKLNDQNSNSKSNMSANIRGRKASGNSCSNPDLVIPIGETEDHENINLSEVLVNLEIQKDENEALKTALQSTLQAKEEDLRLYSTTMEETKSVFLQALRQVKQGATTS